MCPKSEHKPDGSKLFSVVSVYETLITTDKIKARNNARELILLNACLSWNLGSRGCFTTKYLINVKRFTINAEKIMDVRDRIEGK